MYKFFLGCIMLALIPQCQPSKKVGEKPSNQAIQVERVQELPLPSNPRMMRRALYTKGKLLWVYGTGQKTFAHKYQKLGESISENYGERMNVQVIPDTSLHEDSLRSLPAILIGTPTGNKWLQALLPKLPYSLHQDSLLFANKSYPLYNTVWNLHTYPHPFNPFLPIGIISSKSDELLLDYLESRMADRNRRFGRSPWDYELVQEGERVMMGYFSHKPEDPWSFDPTSQWDFIYNPKERKMGEYFPYILHGTVNKDLLEKLWASSQHALEALQKDVGIGLDNWEFPVHVFESAEAKGLELGNTQQAHVEFDKNRVCLVAHEAFPYMDVAPINRMVLRKELGKPKQKVLEEGLANLYSAPWNEGGAKTWGKRLFEAGGVESLNRLLSDSRREDSPIIRACMSALWVEFIREKLWVNQDFRQNYLSWDPTKEEIADLQEPWTQFLQDLPSRPIQRPMPSLGAGPQHMKGFNFAHEGYNIYDGYLSRKAQMSIERMNKLGATSLSIVPYTGTGNTESPTRFRFSNFAGGENDESVVMSNFFAQQLGMSTVLKPQIWVRGAWPGDIQMKNQRDWDQFFRYYKHWILHYAMLAELNQMDIFCIGVELKYATLEQPQAWRSLIQSIRKLYGGPLVYAANWGEEFEGLSFWEELDYIGIDFYYPLGEHVEISERELRQNFRRELKKVENISKQYQKPVLLTEIGFRSITAPWQMPHEHPGNKAHNAQHQAICYKIVLEELQAHEWCEGIYFWKWPSYIEFTRPDDKDYSPIGKPAEEVLSELF